MSLQQDGGSAVILQDGTVALMNWQKLLNNDTVVPGKLLEFRYGAKTVRGTIMDNGNVGLDGQVYSRPSSAWASLGNGSKNASWWDTTFYDGVSLSVL